MQTVTASQEARAAMLGMWLFLGSELLLFALGAGYRADGFGDMALSVAMAIALVGANGVALVFMHLAAGSVLERLVVVASASVLWLLALFLTVDVWTR